MCEDCVNEFGLGFGENYCSCGCGAELEYESCFEGGMDFEGAMVNALRALSPAERDAIGVVIKNRLPICVGTWGVNGEKQSYTCLMGTAAAVMTDNPINAWVADYLEDANGAGSSSSFLRDCGLTAAGVSEVPGAFDNLFEARADLTVPAVGGVATLLNARGRDLLSDLLAQANR